MISLKAKEPNIKTKDELEKVGVDLVKYNF